MPQQNLLADLPVCPHWERVKADCPAAHAIFARHYSYGKNGIPKARSFSPGYKIVLLSHDRRALFVWIWQRYGHVANRPYCLAFRNEASTLGLASALILTAEAHVAREGWLQNCRLPAITFVCPKATKGDGLCFKKAGWTKQKDKTKTGLIILTKRLAL